MNTGNIKKYAPKARTRFIETMTRQAARYGISSGHKGEGHVAPAEVRGDVMLISALDGQTHSFPKALRGPREALAKWVTQLGFEQAMEQAAYSWFNRLCAIRFMELKGYLDHGRRVLSHPDHEGGFQILDDCLEIDLPGLDTARVRELKLDGTQDEALYRELLLAQCHALHEAMPFLFEPLDDASELLLPDNLTKTDSLIRELVEAIPEEDWQDVEVIGWLYQFYIAEKKDQVIGKVVKSEDIPAATQLFTPNWIVQYLVQNSVGRQWLQTYPDSPLKGEMPYYIEPAEQEPEVQAQLDAITPASIDPETIKVLDPACGSGHILVEAYNVLKAIYEERGYRSRDIPKLILENNLFGLDIDDRAAQLAGFALLMKAREDDRRIFRRLVEDKVRLNVMALQSTQHLDASALWRDLNLTGDWHQGQSQSLFESEQKPLSSNDNTYKAIVDLIERFQDAKTFGSLIEVPNSFEAPLKTLLDELTDLADSGDTMQKTAARQLMPVVQQAWILAKRYQAVAANPPYMGTRYQPKKVKKYLKSKFPGSHHDLFSSFIMRCFSISRKDSSLAFMTPFVWMFISSYESFRERVIKDHSLASLVQLEYSSFDSAAVAVCAFSIDSIKLNSYKGSYIRLSSFKGSKNQPIRTAEAIKEKSCPWRYDVSLSFLENIPGRPLVYWASSTLVDAFKNKSIGDDADCSTGLQTGDNDRFIRYWHEVSVKKIGIDYNSRDSALDSGCKWFPSTKSGGFRKWYGGFSNVVNWEDDGKNIKEKKARDLKEGRITENNSKCWNQSHYFKPCIGWPLITSGDFSAKFFPHGFIFDINSPSVFSEKDHSLNIMGFLNSNVGQYFIDLFSPTVNTSPGVVKNFPIVKFSPLIREKIERAIEISREQWDSYEISWGFQGISNLINLSGSFKESRDVYTKNLSVLNDEIAEIEKDVDCYYTDAYGLSEDPVALSCQSRGKTTFLESPDEFLIKFISYSIGCIMGRYSLDKPGLILASQGETVRDYLAQIPVPSFAPDKNAIIPLTDQEWFPDDAANRFRDFVRTVWGEEHLQENLDFVAESLCLHAIKPKKGEAALDTIRRYLSTQFYKDHLRTYKKRPIYWLFSSGKQKAFECLVYLHRYNESTLAEMRTDYVIPLTEKLTSYVEKLEQDKEASASAAEAKRIEKELSKLYKQQAELNTFDEKLRHYADQRISLDLDDGVKLNYGKFGDLLAEVKAVTGEKAG